MNMSDSVAHGNNDGLACASIEYEKICVFLNE